MVRAATGNWAMLFSFGGLASMSHGAASTAPTAHLVTQAGFKRVLSERWMVLFFLGTGFDLLTHEDTPGDTEHEWVWNLGFGLGVEHHFRIWRRISPFVGVNLGFGFRDPKGEEWHLAIGLEGVLGVEYFIADRVSLSVMYQMGLKVTIYSNNPSTDSATGSYIFATSAGGSAVLAFYF